ncbi:hypothetical protein AX14_005938 [Amanita brunnescens Koide BX004]|nr:hypothetical protein AX14_005938 [Amanita brunnescens Koide BX004]
MFKFDFQVDLDDELDVSDFNLASFHISGDESVLSAPNNRPGNFNPSSEISIVQLLDALPQAISYSPLSISLSSDANPLILARRDHFDARFQLISEGRDESNKLQFFDAPSDLVQGVYEGGLKTWECCLDLVDYLESNGLSKSLVGKRILEVGCGTAVPSMYLLYRALCSPTGSSAPLETQIHLQDYNSSVLELITLPNLLITWYISAASVSYRATLTPGNPSERPDPSIPSEINITPELKSAFLSSLSERNISLRFFAGSWETFDFTNIPPQKYNIVLTSETIYRAENLPSLVTLLRSACLGITPNEGEKPTSNPSLCLVAAKAVYFGVGGGVSNFIDAVEGNGSREKLGTVETVWETKTGVKRNVLSVTWNQ